MRNEGFTYRLNTRVLLRGEFRHSSESKWPEKYVRLPRLELLGFSIGHIRNSSGALQAGFSFGC